MRFHDGDYGVPKCARQLPDTKVVEYFDDQSDGLLSSASLDILELYPDRDLQASNLVCQVLFLSDILHDRCHNQLSLTALKVHIKPHATMNSDILRRLDRLSSQPIHYLIPNAITVSQPM